MHVYFKTAKAPWLDHGQSLSRQGSSYHISAPARQAILLLKDLAVFFGLSNLFILEVEWAPVTMGLVTDSRCTRSFGKPCGAIRLRDLPGVPLSLSHGCEPVTRAIFLRPWFHVDHFVSEWCFSSFAFHGGQRVNNCGSTRDC